MRKKITTIIGVMILSMMMFGCNSDTLKTPKNLELKDEYKTQVSKKYAETFNNTVEKYIELYNKNDKLEILDLNPLLELDLSDGKIATELSDTERLLIGYTTKISTDLINECDKPTNETRTKLKEDLEAILDLYK